MTEKATVGKFEAEEFLASPQLKDLRDWDIAIYATGETVLDDSYPDANGSPSVGHICHLVALNPETGDLRMSDPGFPSVVWQTVLKRLAERSLRKDNWITFHLKVVPGKKQGWEVYMPVAIPTEERKDDLHNIITEYMVKEVGLAEDAPLTELRTEIVAEIVSDSNRAEITAR
jgi:hypothetical protein